MPHNCQVCSIRSKCESDSLYLFAPTPILSTRVESVLRESSVAFSVHDNTFALRHASDRDALLEILEKRLSAPEAADLRITYDLAKLMSAVSLTQAKKRADTSWFENALVHDQFVHWFQPIVNARESRLEGHECLIRLPRVHSKFPFWNGQEIVDAAIARGDLHVFDSYSRGAAIRNAARQSARGKVFINFTPSSIYDPAFCMASTLAAMESTDLKPEDIVFEVIECEEIGNPQHLRKIVDYYRAKGFQIALDDIGTGSNSLQMMNEVQPDYIKLDKSLVWNCSKDLGLRTIRKLAELGAETGMKVIAEGVETAAMRDTMLEAGVVLMQGYFFGKPAPAMIRAFPDACVV